MVELFLEDGHENKYTTIITIILLRARVSCVIGVENSPIFFGEGDIESPRFVDKVLEKYIDNAFVVPDHGVHASQFFGLYIRHEKYPM